MDYLHVSTFGLIYLGFSKMIGICLSESFSIFNTVPESDVILLKAKVPNFFSPPKTIELDPTSNRGTPNTSLFTAA